MLRGKLNLKYYKMDCKKCTNRLIYTYDKKTLVEKGSYVNTFVFFLQIKIKKIEKMVILIICVYTYV